MGREARTWVSDIVLDSGTPTATDQFAQCSIQLEHFRRSVPLVGAAQIEPCLTAKARSRCSIASGCAHCVVRRNDDKSATMAFVVVKYPISDWAIRERTNRPVAATDACHVPALQRENGDRESTHRVESIQPNFSAPPHPWDSLVPVASRWPRSPFVSGSRGATSSVDPGIQ